MQVTDELIRSVVQEVLKHARNGKAPAAKLVVERWKQRRDWDSTWEIHTHGSNAPGWKWPVKT